MKTKTSDSPEKLKVVRAGPQPSDRGPLETLTQIDCDAQEACGEIMNIARAAQRMLSKDPHDLVTVHGLLEAIFNRASLLTDSINFAAGELEADHNHLVPGESRIWAEHHAAGAGGPRASV